MEIFEHRIRLDNPREKVVIVPIADLHIGTIACDMGLVRRTVDIIRNRKNHYWFTIGDNTECISEKDFRHRRAMIPERYGETRGLVIDAQLSEAADILRPIADKCLGIGKGNHEDTLISAGVTNPVHRLTEALGGKRYLGSEGQITVKLLCNRRSFSTRITYRHGWQRSGESSTSINRMIGALQIYDYDVCVGGHIHQADFKDFDQVNLVNGKYVTRKRMCIVCPGFRKSKMPGVDDYGDSAAKVMSPTRLRVPAIELDFAGKERYYIPELH